MKRRIYKTTFGGVTLYKDLSDCVRLAIIEAATSNNTCNLSDCHVGVFLRNNTNSIYKYWHGSGYYRPGADDYINLTNADKLLVDIPAWNPFDDFDFPKSTLSAAAKRVVNDFLCDDDIVEKYFSEAARELKRITCSARGEK